MAVVRCLGCMSEYEGEYGVCPHCGYEAGTPAQSALHMMPGTVLNGRYTVGRAVGFGGFGVTYIGWDELLARRVAIKEYLPSEFATRVVGQTRVTVFGGERADQFADGLSKFVDEAKRLAKFQNEPGIVRIFDSFKENDTAYIVMEYLEGETLSAYLDRERKIDPQTAVRMLTPVLKSLEIIHAEGIIHRDIAPDNIMITKNGGVKLIDFGAARYATVSHSRSLTVMIKPGYSPEEQYRSRGDQGAHTDVYAVAAVLYRMITGITPPDALERRAFFENKKKDILIPPSKNSEITKNMETALLNAMNVRVQDRTPAAAVFLKELTSKAPVTRRAGKIKAIDMMRWPLWAKTAIPVSGLAVIAAALLLATGRISFVSHLTDRFVIGEDMARVPSVINCSVGTAQEKLDGKGFMSVIKGREISDVIPANMVLRQGAGAGRVMKKGTSIDLYISSPPETKVLENFMPDLTFYTFKEAEKIIKDAGISVNIKEEYSPDVARGIVMYSEPGLGAPLKGVREVTLFVSGGTDPKLEDKKTLRMNHSTVSLFVGETVTLTASGAGGTCEWSSSDTGVARVSGGTVTATGRGSAKITVTSRGESADCTVSVQDYELSLSENHVTLIAGDSAWLTAYGAPSGTDISWGSSDTGVAKVSGGTVTAVNPGSATVTALMTVNGRKYKDSCSVRVNPRPVRTLTVFFNPNGGSVNEGSRSVKVGGPIGTLPVPARDYYTFDGWYTSTGGGSRIREDSTFPDTSDVTLYARWTQKPVSDWVKAGDMPSGAQVVERKWTYDKTSYTTSSSSRLSGWTRYDTTYEWSSYDEWSGWSTTAVSGSDSRQVQTKQEEILTGYNTECYNTMTPSAARQFRDFSVNGNYAGYGLASSYGEYHFTKKAAVSEIDNAVTVPAGAYTDKCTYPGTNKSSKIGYILVESGTTTFVFFIKSSIYETRTYYRYRDRYEIPTYHFKKTEALESTAKPTGGNISNLQEWVQYRPR